MRLRWVAAGVALVLAAGVLTSCRTNVGVAATVDGHRISENTVGDYVLESGPRTSASASASSDDSTNSPKSIVVNYLVLREVFRSTLAANGGVPSAAKLASVRDKAVQLLLSSPITGAAFEKSLETQLGAAAIKSSLAGVYLAVQELEYTLVERNKLASPAEVVSAINKAKVSVRVNPRYGTFVHTGSQLGIDPTGSTPAYLHLQGTTSGT